jgi:hypothetical protein
MAKFAQSFGFNLSDPFASYVKILTDFFQSVITLLTVCIPGTYKLASGYLT